MQVQEGRGRVSGYCSHALSLPPLTPTHPPTHPPSRALSPSQLTPPLAHCLPLHSLPLTLPLAQSPTPLTPTHPPSRTLSPLHSLPLTLPLTHCLPLHSQSPSTLVPCLPLHSLPLTLPLPSPSPFLYLCTFSPSTPTHPPFPFLYFLYFTLQEGNLEEQIAGTPFNQPYIAVHGTDGLCHEHVFSHRKVGCVQCQLCFPGY